MAIREVAIATVRDTILALLNTWRIWNLDTCWSVRQSRSSSGVEQRIRKAPPVKIPR
jgi:hypothetical protein